MLQLSFLLFLLLLLLNFSSRTCGCQGEGREGGRGASYTFGCSASSYMWGSCKFVRSKFARKFHLKRRVGRLSKAKFAERRAEQGRLAATCTTLADWVGSIFRGLAPAAHRNMSVFGGAAAACRLGSGAHRRPFSGVTAVADYTAHRHRDGRNMVGGATAILTLRRRAAEEQLHVLPQYRPDLGAMEEAVAAGGVEVLTAWSNPAYRRQVGGEEEVWEEVEDSGKAAFASVEVGGLAVALSHGSVAIEVAKEEVLLTSLRLLSSHPFPSSVRSHPSSPQVHATTPLSAPSAASPSRIGLVFYQHHSLHHPGHGSRAWHRRRGRLSSGF